MNESTQYRHDISDETCAVLSPIFPGQRWRWGGLAKDNRNFINGVLWSLWTGSPWRDLPPEYGKWNTAYRRVNRWRDYGIWGKVLEILMDDPDYEWLMMEISDCKAQHASTAKDENQDMVCKKENSTPRSAFPWMRLVCRSEDLSHNDPGRTAKKLYD